jgi:hypothetical protein
LVGVNVIILGEGAVRDTAADVGGGTEADVHILCASAVVMETDTLGLRGARHILDARGVAVPNEFVAYRGEEGEAVVIFPDNDADCRILLARQGSPEGRGAETELTGDTGVAPAAEVIPILGLTPVVTESFVACSKE